ncbi:RNA-binding motif protein, X-linked 2 [Petaurus breviceps papuanus]|uniref:RNA-binding motif protein, X-linked 2 n=1 Tax=Petaurus breviceps papuanus TaxID=3040969 RepID=UPI0036DBE386
MNALTKVKLINELNEREVELGVAEKVSWHAEYKDSAWIFLGGLPYELTEGDIICVFSQYGEIVNINLVRDKKTGKSKGFCFLCYEDQRSTILAVDNFNGIKIRGRTIRVDHVANYRPPKDSRNLDDITRTLREKGCGLKTPPPSSSESSEEETLAKKQRKDKKEKRKKKDRDGRMSMEKQEMPASSSTASRYKTKKGKEDISFEKSATVSLEKGSSPERREGQKYSSVSPVLPRGQLEKAETSRRDLKKKEKPWHKKSSSSSSRKEKRREKSKYRDRSRSSEKRSHHRDERSESRSKKRHKHKSRSFEKDCHSRDREPPSSSRHRSS